MFGVLFNFTSFLFFVNIIAELLSWLRLFDDKEYNFRRVFVHFRDTKVGKASLIGRASITKWVLIFSYAATIFWNVDEEYHIAVFTLYLILSVILLKRVAGQNFRLPRINPTSISILLSVLFVESSLFLFLPLDPYLWMLIINKLLFVFVFIFVSIFSIFFDFLRDAQINKAISKIISKRNLLTIAVVGSFGRGSTKEFLSNVLSEKFDVLDVNTAFSDAFGIAKVVNTKLTNSKQVFIAEMDDYKKGDISEMAAIVLPKIVIVTGINEQKISTYGKMDNVISSKFEAIEALSKDGIALFNGGSKYNKELFAKTPNKKFTYALGKSGDIVATNIKESKFNLSFDVKVLGKTYKLNNVKLLGKSNIDNLLPAIFIAAYIGMDFSLIKKAISKTRPLKSAMEPRLSNKGAVLIDDSHNANINSVTRAVSYVEQYKGKKVLVLEPLVELGKSAKLVHEEIGKMIGKSCNYLFLTNDNYHDALAKGVKKSGSNCRIIIDTPAKISYFIRENCKKEDVVVFEGKESSRVLSLINSKRIYPSI